MEPNSYASSSSSSASFPQEETKTKRITSFLSSLHSVRRPLPKPMTKKPIAPFPPTPPKVYKVDPPHFKEAVQRLTSVRQFGHPTRRLQDIAPPPLDLSSTAPLPLFKNYTLPPRPPPSQPVPEETGSLASPLVFDLTPNFCSFLRETLDEEGGGVSSESSGVPRPLGLSCSPSFRSLMSETLNTKPYNPMEGYGLLSPLSFPPSPSSVSWYSLAVLSPGA